MTNLTDETTNLNNPKLPIALDAMGGDNMPEATVAGAKLATEAGISIVLVGDEDKLRPLLTQEGLDIPIHHADDVIGMDESASDVRRRKGSSIMQTFELVKNGEAAAGVSLGHSGATMAAALLQLGRIAGIDRPAIAATLPTPQGHVLLLDAGANADCRPRYLQHFAIMGSVYSNIVLGIENPSVGLMSVGEEDDKGNELSKAAFTLLKKTNNINFFGNIEGRDPFSHTTDIVVTDGFTGNIILKLAEGEAKVLMRWMVDTIKANWLAKIGGLLIKGTLKKFVKQLDPNSYGAQPLLGVDGYAFIGHGSANSTGVFNALKTAQKACDENFLPKLKAHLAAN